MMNGQTLKNVGIGFVVGAVLGFVPLLMLFAPLVGGGVAGYLERAGTRRGAAVGATTGLLLAVFGALAGGLVFAVNATRMGAVSGMGGFFGVLPARSVAVIAVIWLVGAVVATLVAAIGGALGAIVAADRGASEERRASEADPASDRAPETDAGSTSDDEGRLNAEGGPSTGGSRRRTVVAAVVSLLAGAATFVGVAFGLTALLDPYIWPSALVGLPAGIVAGVAAAVLGYHLLATRLPGHPPGNADVRA